LFVYKHYNSRKDTIIDPCWSMASGYNQRCPEYDALVDMTDELCRALPINDMLSSLTSLRVLEHSDADELRTYRTSREKVERFIERHMCPNLVIGDTRRFLDFITAMRQSSKCDFLVERLEERIRHHRIQSRRCSTASPNCFSLEGRPRL